MRDLPLEESCAAARRSWDAGHRLRRAGCLFLVVLGGCYRYTPTTDSPAAAADVRLHLSADGARAAAPVIGEGVTSVTGRVLSATESELVLTVSETAGADRRVSWAGERITLPRSSVTGIERRSLDRWRTVGVGAVGIGAVGAIALIVNALGSRADGDGDGGPIIIPPEP